MQIDQITVSDEEVKRVEETAYPSGFLFDSGHSNIPLWAIVALSLTVAIPPLLWLLIVALRFAIRNQPIYVKYPWVCLFSTLMIISGVLGSVALAAFLSLPAMPAALSNSISDFDQKQNYPHLPSTTSLDSAEVSIELKPLVIVVSPLNELRRGREAASSAFGAGVLLLANREGYLFATARHVIGSGRSVPRQVLITSGLGTRASADVVATAKTVDLALLWIDRRSGDAAFTQPLGEARDGEPIFVIGHPEGLNYTLSTGIVSGLRGTNLQISAAVSPGNSGGPVYDVHGNLVGIVSSKFDQTIDANAENLGFATIGGVLKEKSGWNFTGNGAFRLQQYIQTLNYR